MEILEKVNRAFGSWYEGLFGGNDDVRPKDILRRIFVTMEDNRKEHLDDRIYVPNHYILEIAVDDEEEKEYLRSFLVRDELETAIRRYCKQNRYEIRGGLEFTIQEVEPEPEGRRREKVRVRARYDSRLVTAPAATSAESGASPGASTPPAFQTAGPQPSAGLARGGAFDDEDATVYGGQEESDEAGTVPAVAFARLTVYPPSRPPFDYTVAKSAVTVGRSPKAGNDIVVDDEKVSRRHARLEMERDGSFTVYDLDTTNGTRINGRRVDNGAVKSGDEISVGDTRMVFKKVAEEAEAPAVRTASTLAFSGQAARAPRVVLMDGDNDVEELLLSSETIVGRAATNDIVLNDRSVATRHVLIKSDSQPGPHTLEVLDADHLTLLNGSQLRPGEEVALHTGDRVGLGTVTLRFEEGNP